MTAAPAAVMPKVAAILYYLVALAILLIVRDALPFWMSAPLFALIFLAGANLITRERATA